VRLRECVNVYEEMRRVRMVTDDYATIPYTHSF
jgi:hypothetical protein